MTESLGEGRSLRVGMGYDVHRLIADRKLILGGVHIDYHLGLEGHSDADVLVHALMDAILGAAAMGDIGELFPPSDPSYRGANSLKLLEQIALKVGEAGFFIVNVDAVVCAQAPKLLTYREQIRQNIACSMKIPPEDVGFKATTSEGLGFEGRGEGISAWAVALLDNETGKL